jgi:membrane glycosyltransferase
MGAGPRADLIQASVRLAGRGTLFARIKRFCQAAYGNVAGAGSSLWHGCDGNFNGHNAILRVAAFASTCGLPDLPGRKPFGGHILSHDFVEAALLRRAGWDVYMRPDINGTYEESPPNLVEFAKRDRRWTQGNLQHARLLSAAGFHWMSRLHLTCGILAYLSSVLWFLFLITGVSIAVHATLVPREYFPEIHSLFPEWPVFDAGLALKLTGFSLSVLLVPKVLGYLAVLTHPALRAGAGGGAALTLSVVVETLLSALLAPVFMIIQTTHVAEILLARDSGWPQQRRDDGALAVAEVARRLWLCTFAGVVLAVGSYYLNPGLFFWLAPIWSGLLLAIPLAVVTSSHALGLRCRELGLFVSEEEIAPQTQPAGAAQQDAPQQLAA